VTPKNITILSLSVVLLAALAAESPHARAQVRRPLLVIVSSTTEITDISFATLRRVFSGSSAEYRPGKRFLPLNHPIGSSDRVLFDRTVMGLAPDDVGRYWVDQKIRGSAPPPRTLPSAELAVRVVASFPGAITYTDPSLVGPGLKILTVDNRAVSDPSYLFAR
jgi:hypothetical protein